MKKLHWINDPHQKVWLKIALLFALFYFGEAYLFWYPNPRFHAPPFTPLVYWGLFGLAIFLTLRNANKKNHSPRHSAVPRAFESITLTVAITTAVIGIPFLIIQQTNNITLGHTALLIAIFQAGAIIAGMSGNLGWLLASLLWLAAAAVIFLHPARQDYTLGLAVAAGFAIIGLLPQCARTAE